MPKPKDKAARSSRQTKDKVLQARIPDDLDEELRDRARTLGLSVSSIVRNVLLNTFDLVESVVADSSQIASAVKGKSQNSRQPLNKGSQDGSEQVLGWQEITLNRNALCESCNAILAKGTHASIGVPVQDNASFLCLSCLAAMQATATEVNAEDPAGLAKPQE